MKSFNTPPPAIEKLMSMIAILRPIKDMPTDGSWDTGKKILSQPTFIPKLMGFAN